MAKPVTVNDVLDGQVSLDLECPDRVYLNAYVPNLQVGGQVVSFLTAHLGYPIPSPAIFDKIGTAFRRAVGRFADEQHIPVVRFAKTDRKIEKMRPYLDRQAPTGPAGGGGVGSPGGAGRGWPRSGSPRNTPACSPAPGARAPTVFPGSVSPRPTGECPAT